MNAQKQAKPKYRPSMFRHGLVLVMVPLVVGTCVTLFMSHLWHSAEAMANEEQRYTTFIKHLNLAFDRWADVSTAVAAGTLEDNPEFARKIETSTPLLRREFVGLRKMAKKIPGRLPKVERLEELFQEEINMFAGISRYGADSDVLAKINRMPKTLGKTLKIRTAVRNLLNNEIEDLIAFRKKEDRSQKTMQMAAYGFIAGNILLACVLVALFSISVNRRMRILIENATCIPRGEELKQHLSGNDELAYLDEILSDTARKLSDAAEHRKSIFGMVAHDMRSPLMAAQNFLQLIMETDSNITDESKAYLEASDNRLSDILQHVQTLLTVEKERTEKAKLEAGSLSEKVETTPGSSPQTSGNVERLDKPKPNFLSTLLSFVTRPKLFHQVLALVLAPLAVQTLFLLAINQQIINMQNLSNRARRHSDIRTYYRIAQMDLVRSSAAQGIFLITEHEGMRNLALKTYDQALKEWEKIIPLAKSDPEWSKVIDDLKDLMFGKTTDVLKLKRTDSPTKINEVLHKSGEVGGELEKGIKTRNEAASLYERDKSRLEKMEQEQNRANQQLSQILSWSIAGNILMALGVLFLFTTNLNRRLQILVRNASSLGKREELKEQVKGTDELAYLDLILHQAKEQLNLASHQRSQMMSSLADDMRRPLIDAQSQLKQFEENQGSALQDRSKNQLQRSEGNIDRVLKLIDDLLTMETLEEGKIDLELGQHDAASIVDDALSTVSSLAKLKQIELVNKCQEQVIRADRSRIGQVLINYLSNAIKFSPQNTTITVSSQTINGSIKIAVVDQGPGMDEETRTKVFEKFFQAQTAEKKQGFGLGLAICSLIVESHHGKLGVDSEPGKGSSFWFEIPIQNPTDH